jgi:hypothetical protein
MSFSPEKIDGFYQAPMAIYSDQGIQLVDDQKDVLAFWKEGVKPYAEQGISKTVTTVLSEEQLSEKNYTSKVQWVNYDSSGKETSRETNYYILSGQPGELKITGLILMTK